MVPMRPTSKNCQSWPATGNDKSHASFPDSELRCTEYGLASPDLKPSRNRQVPMYGAWNQHRLRVLWQFCFSFRLAKGKLA